MDLNRLKNGIIQKQDEIKELESKIITQESEIKVLTESLAKAEEQHKQTVKSLNDRLNTFETTQGKALPDEIIQLKQQIQEKINYIEHQSNLHVQQAIREAQQHVRPAYQTVQEKIEERSHEQKEQFRRNYISQLQKEKDKLQEDLQSQKRQNNSLREEIGEIEENIRKLRHDLRFVMSDAVDKGAQLREQISSYNAEEEVPQKPQAQQQMRSPQRPPKVDLHRKCANEQQTYQQKIDTLSRQIFDLKSQLKTVIDGSVGALRDCGLLERFMANDRVALNDEERQDLCQKMAADQTLVEALIALGQRRGQGVKLPFLKDQE